MLPLVYYNTPILIVDDNLPFLKTLSLELAKSGEVIIESDPIHGLDRIRQQEGIYQYINRYILSTDEVLDADGQFSSVNFSALRELVHVENRYNDISVVVVDYTMPKMNGLEFCHEINDLPIKKILLTGDGTFELAVNAFNDGVIHAFFKKDKDHVSEDLLNKIRELKLNYFYHVDRLLPPINTILLASEEYKSTVTSWINDYHIQESFVVDEYGSRIGITDSGEQKKLLFVSKLQMDAYLEQASAYTELSFIQDIKNGNKVIHFFDEGQKQLDVSMWSELLFDVTGRINLNDSVYIYSFA